MKKGRYYLGNPASRPVFSFGLRTGTRENAMTTAEDHLMDWLRNTHAMEEQAEAMLGAQLNRILHYPALKSRIQQHQMATAQQRQGSQQQAAEGFEGHDCTWA